ncbi:MAG: hypothetical protein Q9163_001978 [Psora crenata]
MATENNTQLGWPLALEPSEATLSPPSSPAPGKSSKDGPSSQPSVDAPKRRPLSYSQGNATIARAPADLLSVAHSKSNVEGDSRPAPRRDASFGTGDDAFMRQPFQQRKQHDEILQHQEEYAKRHARRRSSGPLPVPQSIPYRQTLTTEPPVNVHQPQSGIISSVNGSAPSSRHTSGDSSFNITRQEQGATQLLKYHHRASDVDENGRRSADSSTSRRQMRTGSGDVPPVPLHESRLTPSSRTYLGANLPRPSSAYSLGSNSSTPARTLSPGGQNDRTISPSRQSPDPRPMSFVDLLNVPYPQPPPAPASLDNTLLRSSVGENATLLNTKKTLEMYRANVKKTNDPTIQYEFAVFMVNAAVDVANDDDQPPTDADQGSTSSQADLLREARHILQKLSDRSYPFAQYYLGDGYASGLFNKGVPDNDRAFPLFVAASKHGHAEAGYRAALCYEFGWGCRKDVQKAVQFYRQSASKNHPGAMARLGRACLMSDMGLGNRYREGLKWLKRAAESADPQYNSAPYELGLLHETGYGDDIFQDPSYAAQLFTQSADLGHVEANYRLGDSYEHGKLNCPKDPALSVHFYTGAAQRGHPLAMMALCAWYMVGAEPVLEKDENEAYEWARKAAGTGLPKAEYAVGYFTEMGIGCRRDPLEANVWYVKAADQGDERAKQRIAAIRAAASGGSSTASGGAGSAEKGKEDKVKKKWGLF